MICGYEVWDTVVMPNYVVNITEQFARKCELMQIYELPMQAMDFVKLIECRATVNYMLHVNQALKQGQTGYSG